MSFTTYSIPAGQQMSIFIKPSIATPDFCRADHVSMVLRIISFHYDILQRLKERKVYYVLEDIHISETCVQHGDFVSL